MKNAELLIADPFGRESLIRFLLNLKEMPRFFLSSALATIFDQLTGWVEASVCASKTSHIPHSLLHLALINFSKSAKAVI